jgi:hypothetical protein
MIAMARSLFILDDAPYGPESCYIGARLAGALSKREGFKVTLLNSPPLILNPEIVPWLRGPLHWASLVVWLET